MARIPYLYRKLINKRVPPEVAAQVADTEYDPEHATEERAYSAAGAESGFAYRLDLDYDTNNPELPEPVLVRVRNAAATLLKSYWLNESGLPRAWAIRKDEPALKLHAFSNASTGAVLEVRGKWNDGAPRRWGINAQGRPLLGENAIVGNNMVVLGAADPVPAGLPANTVILRTS